MKNYVLLIRRSRTHFLIYGSRALFCWYEDQELCFHRSLDQKPVCYPKCNICVVLLTSNTAHFPLRSPVPKTTRTQNSIHFHKKIPS